MLAFGDVLLVGQRLCHRALERGEDDIQVTLLDIVEEAGQHTEAGRVHLCHRAHVEDKVPGLRMLCHELRDLLLGIADIAEIERAVDADDEDVAGVGLDRGPPDGPIDLAVGGAAEPGDRT